MSSPNPKALPKAVLKAIRRGWSVFPVGLDKRPVIIGKKPDGSPMRLAWKRYQTQRATEDQAAEWQRRFKPAAWAVITGEISGIFITDHDEYKPGAITLAALGFEGKENVHTGSGGKHLYWPHPGYRVPTLSSEQTKALEAAGFPGFDIRGDGGYAIFFGDNSHGHYKWLSPPDPNLRPEMLPQALLDACKFWPPQEDRSDPTPEPAYTPPAATHTGRGLTPFPEWALHRALANQASGRNAAGFALACMLRDQGMSQSEAADIMRQYQARAKGDNTKGQREPYTWDEAQASLQTAYSQPRRAPIAPAELRTGPSQLKPAAAVPAEVTPKRPAEPEAEAPHEDAAPAEDPATFDEEQRTLSFDGQDVKARSFKPSDVGNAERLIVRHGRDLRYCHQTEEWLIWDTKRYAVDQSGGIVRKAIETVRSIYTDANKEGDDDKRKRILQHALKSESNGALNAMVSIAQKAPNISVLPAELDANPWLLNFPNGTMDLRNQKLRTHARGDLMTKMIRYPYDAAATCPTWDAFIQTALADKDTGDRDQDYESFIQRAIGYSLTGDVSEKVLFTLHGQSNAGKTTFAEVVRAVLGGYAGQIRIDALMHQKNAGRGDEASPEIADLQGRRFVITSETEEGQRLAEAKVKYLTGMGLIRCRRLYQESIEFPQTWKFFMDCNHLPRIQGSDAGIWNRIRRVPFDNVPPVLDRTLRRRILRELPGIMAWAIRGCALWMNHGLGDCARSREATDEYRQEQDSVSRFIQDCCILADSFSVPGKLFYQAYEAWCEEANEYTISRKALAGKLKDAGIVGKHENSGVRYVGIRIRTPEEEPAAAPGSDGYDGSETLSRKTSRGVPSYGSYGNSPHNRHTRHAPAEEREF